jgi:hypothetical protein
MRDLADRALEHRDGAGPGWVRVEHETASLVVPLDRHASLGVER